MAAAVEEVVPKKAEAEEAPAAVAVMGKSNDVVQHKPAAKIPEPIAKTSSKGSLDRDVALAMLEDEKRLSYIKAWEESEKTKAENKAQKKLSDVTSWENTKKAALESELKSIEEKMQKKKGEYAEKIRNKVGLVHKQAEEKRAMVESKRGEELLKVEETVAKLRATNQAPPKACGCLGG
ncbi:remorin-like [Salvia divinorum]|uniref:Remorin-like n=1 Tax=Salvia divinorum TaxID=28513 RepID=A0ABD1GQ96_SALDI